MSRSLAINYQYKNNRTNGIGMHNPGDNIFRKDDYKHLGHVYNEFIIPKLKQNKFKDEVRVIEHVDGKEIYNKMIEINSVNRFIEDITDDRMVR